MISLKCLLLIEASKGVYCCVDTHLSRSRHENKIGDIHWKGTICSGTHRGHKLRWGTWVLQIVVIEIGSPLWFKSIHFHPDTYHIVLYRNSRHKTKFSNARVHKGYIVHKTTVLEKNIYEIERHQLQWQIGTRNLVSKLYISISPNFY